MTPALSKKSRGLMPAKRPHGSVPAQVNFSDAVAIQALAAGKANEGQQKHALKWILEGACALPHWPYLESERETNVALGRHFVGQQIVGAMRVNTSKLRSSEDG
jgi:hypothetical protein